MRATMETVGKGGALLAGEAIVSATKRDSAPTVVPVRNNNAEGLYDPLQERDSCGVGFIVSLKNRKSHRIVQDGLRILENLEHRGATGADPLMGDGAGLMVQIPHGFFAREAKRLGFALPEPGAYAVSHIFMPKDATMRAAMEKIVAEVIAEEGQVLLGWRDVPVDNTC